MAEIRCAIDRPSNDVFAVATLMKEWLLGTIANAGTDVDTGCGMGSYDLWVKVGEREIHIVVRDAPPGP